MAIFTGSPEQIKEDMTADRERKFGLFAGADVEIEGNLVKVTIDRPLTGEAKSIHWIEKEKVAAILAREFGGLYVGSANREELKFFPHMAKDKG